MFKSKGDDEAVLDTMTRIIVQWLAESILVPVAKIEWEVPLNKWGMYSMVAAEYRTWLFMALEVDVPVLSLLGETITPKRLEKLV